MSTGVVSPSEVDQLRAVAHALIPGDHSSPAASDLSDYPELLGRAVNALGPEADALRTALTKLPPDVDLSALERFATEDPAAFDVISTAVAGAYFMSEQALRSIGYPVGARHAAPHDQAAEELGTGLLDAVIAREPFVVLPPIAAHIVHGPVT